MNPQTQNRSFADLADKRTDELSDLDLSTVSAGTITVRDHRHYTSTMETRGEVSFDRGH